MAHPGIQDRTSQSTPELFLPLRGTAPARFRSGNLHRISQARSHFLLAALVGLLTISIPLQSQTLNLPPRPANAPTGSQFVNIIASMPLTERENWIFTQIAHGNVPNFLRTLSPVTTNAVLNGNNHIVTFFVTPDYLAVGSDEDYFLTPMTPRLGQRLADLLDCSLPTRKMVNDIWAKAAVKLAPSTIPPSPAMITVPVFNQHNTAVRAQRNAQTNAQPLGALVGGDKKDVVISKSIYANLHTGVPKPVVIYGWHQLNGVPIQPLYNGHEETYADYSHGIRLTQMAVTLDGAPHTITNLLADPNLAPLLSDEGTMALPRYTLPTWAPAIITQPRSQTVSPGSAVTLNVFAVGDPPLIWQWRLNGTNLPAATNSTFSLSDAQPANAGSYLAVASNLSGSVTSRPALLRLEESPHPILFTDDFDTDTSADWNLFQGSANGIPDYTVDWAFDYGVTPCKFNGTTFLIPAAPNSSAGSTRGVKLTVNNNDAIGAIAGVNLYPQNQSFSGNYALQFDMWLNYPGGAGGINSTGSTLHAICGLNHLGTQANWAATSASSTDGLWFGVDGEGGTSRDYRAYAGNPGGVQTELIGTAASGLAASDHTAAVYQMIFPPGRFETSGAPGKNWVAVELRQENSVINWKLDGVLVAQRTNNSAFTSGNVMLGLMDTFSSIANPAADAFVIFDNVRVEDLTPVPPRLDSASLLPNGQFQFALTGTAGDSYWIEASTNLQTWQPISMLTASNSPVPFVDPETSHHHRRFYRARLKP